MQGVGPIKTQIADGAYSKQRYYFGQKADRSIRYDLPGALCPPPASQLMSAEHCLASCARAAAAKLDDYNHWLENITIPHEPFGRVFNVDQVCSAVSTAVMLQALTMVGLVLKQIFGFVWGATKAYPLTDFSSNTFLKGSLNFEVRPSRSDPARPQCYPCHSCVLAARIL